MIWVISIIITIALIGALIISIYTLKKEEQKAKASTVEDELKRSHEYETKSLTSNIRNLLWIYAIVIILSFVVLAIYIFLL
ncbi:hypothetical protein [Oceanobacillus halophilus]|nr:hypothetical protein [Oceanobacillus halophilus]